MWLFLNLEFLKSNPDWWDGIVKVLSNLDSLSLIFLLRVGQYTSVCSHLWLSGEGTLSPLFTLNDYI